MRTTEERIKAMHLRAAKLEQERRDKTVKVLQRGAALICILVIVVMASAIPVLSGTVLTLTQGGNVLMSGSMFSGNNALGFLVIGIIAFLLGISLTIFSYRLKKWQDRKDNETGYDR